jgi:hypothetical protein
MTKSVGHLERPPAVRFASHLAASGRLLGRKDALPAAGPRAPQPKMAQPAQLHAPAVPRERAVPAKEGEPLDDPRLDPMERRHAQLAPPSFVMTAPPAPVETPPPPVAARAAASLETLLPALVKKIAWSGDSKKGTVRMELGAGELSGGTILIHADRGEVSVQVNAPAGIDADAWREKIHQRLVSRGLNVSSVEVA